MNGSTGELLARRRAVSGRAPIAALVDRLCATTTTEAATPIRHGAGRLVVVGGGIGSGRTTALVDAAETCWALGVTAHLILAGEPARPGLLDEILAMPSSEPVLLAVDDADVHHPELLERIVASADALRLRRVLVLAVVRGGELVELPQRISTSGLLERVTERIDLQPFGTAELATLASIAFAAESEGQVAAATDTPVAAAFVAELARATGGIARLVDAALEDLAAGEPDAARVGTLVSDPTCRLRRVADAMLAGVGAPGVETLACAALIDGPIDPALAVAACGERTVEVLQHAVGQGLLTLRGPVRDDPDAPGSVAFAAEALRSAAADRDPLRRPERHLRIAEALLATSGLSTGARDALRHLRAAGEHAPRGLLRAVGDAALEASRTRGDLEGTVEAMETLWSTSGDDRDRWREEGSALATAALHAGRRSQAWITARTVLRSFDALPDSALTRQRRQTLVATALVATAGHEYLTAFDTEAAELLLLRIIGRLGDGVDSVPLLCRAAEIVSMRPHASVFARSVGRPFEGGVGLPDAVQHWQESDEAAEELLDRAAGLLGQYAPAADDPAAYDPDADAADARLHAALDVAWARVHLHDEHAAERRVRLARSLPVLEGFDRAWAGTRLALDALAVGERGAVDQALIDASPGSVASTPLVGWRVSSVRAALQHACAAPDAASLVEMAEAFGRRAAEPMADQVARLQRTMLAVDLDLDRMLDTAFTTSPEGDPHPLVTGGRLEVRARGAALRRALASDAPGGDDVAPALLTEAARLLDVFLAGGVNRGNLNLMLVLLGRALFHLRDVPRDVWGGADGDGMVATVADLLEPYGMRVPTDVLGIVCFGSSARHLANLRAMQGRHAEAAAHARAAEDRDRDLGFDRIVIAGRLDAFRRARSAGEQHTVEARAALLEIAVDAERRGLAQLGREARLAAHPEFAGALTSAQLALLGDLVVGRPFPEIAAMRGYSPGTVRKMALPIYRTLGVAGRDEAVVLAREVGLLR